WRPRGPERRRAPGSAAASRLQKLSLLLLQLQPAVLGFFQRLLLLRQEIARLLELGDVAGIEVGIVQGRLDGGDVLLPRGDLARQVGQLLLLLAAELRLDAGRARLRCRTRR